MLSTILCMLIAAQWRALVYGGLVRSKNVLSMLVQVLSTFCIAIVLWFIYGYTLAFTDGGPLIGGFSRLFFSGMIDLATDRKSTSELQSLMRISYAVFCLKKKKTTTHI